MAYTATVAARSGNNSTTDLNHVFCCIPDLALCGVDISGDEIVDYDEADCIVCLDLEDQTRPVCGE